MANRERKNKAVKVMGIVGASLMIASCLALATFFVLDIAEVNNLLLDGPRYYNIGFYIGDDPVSLQSVRRVDKIVVPPNPSKEGDENWSYTFKGWDINWDGVTDIIPNKAYYEFDAIAVYSKKYIGPKIDPTKPNQPEEPSEEEPGGDN